MRALIVFVLVTSVGRAHGAEEPAKSLTLEDSVQFALGYTTVVLKAARDRELAATQVLQSYLQFLPSVGVQANYTRAQGTTYFTSAQPSHVNGRSYGENVSISASLNVFNGLADLAQWNAAAERRAGAERTLTRAKQSISLDVAQSYLQVVLDQKMIKIAQKNLRASKDREVLLTEQTAVGSRNKSDLFRQQAQTSADESFLISAENKAVTDEIQLLKKLRLRPDAKYVYREPTLEGELVKGAPADDRVDESRAIEAAVRQRVDLQGAHLNAEAARHDVTTARAAYYPRLDLGASYLTSSRHLDYQLVNNNDFTPANQAGLGNQLRENGSTLYGLTLTWNIFDRWTTGLAVERAQVGAAKARWDEEDYRRTVVGEVRQALNDYRRTVQQLDTSRRGLTAAQKAFEVSAGRYEVGSLSYVDLALAQTALVQAEATRAQAVIGFEMAKRSIDFAVGTTATE